MVRKRKLVRTKRSVGGSLVPLIFVAETEALWLQSAERLMSVGAGTERGCRHQTPPPITISHPAYSMKGRQCGFLRGAYPGNGSPSRPQPCCGFTANVRLFFLSISMLSTTLISNHFSWLGEECPLVRYHFSDSRLRNLHHQLALQLYKT